MVGNKEKPNPIEFYILLNVREHPQDITNITSSEFGITRQAVLRYIRKLIDRNLLIAHGRTRDRYYELKPLVVKTFNFEVNEGLEEDIVWRNNLSPLLEGIERNVREICAYGVTEMVNNVIDHSGGNHLRVSLTYEFDLIDFFIVDNGVGIFQKLRTELNLDDNLQAILELAKGKLTTDPENHTGEGIFFTSRAFDSFIIVSGNLYFSHEEKSGDWLLEVQQNITQGTAIRMQINPFSNRKLMNVFDRYASGDDFGFTKTHVPVTLARYGDENLISRSQAKRLLARFDRFQEIVLDFNGVESIGQAFADEIFRVYQNTHPNIHFSIVRASENVQKMVERARGQRK